MRGQVLLEFVISLPFLVFLLIACLELGVLLIQYITLMDIAHVGARLAQQVAELETDPGGGVPPGERTSLPLLEPFDCALVIDRRNPLDPEFQGPTYEPLDFHYRVHSRLLTVLCIERQFSGLQFLEQVAIFTQRIDGTGTDEDGTVLVRLRGRYRGLFPTLFSPDLGVQASAEYLY